MKKAKLRTYLNLVKQATTDGTSKNADNNENIVDKIESVQGTSKGSNEDRNVTDKLSILMTIAEATLRLKLKIMCIKKCHF